MSRTLLPALLFLLAGAGLAHAQRMGAGAISSALPRSTGWEAPPPTEGRGSPIELDAEPAPASPPAGLPGQGDAPLEGLPPAEPQVRVPPPPPAGPEGDAPAPSVPPFWPSCAPPPAATYRFWAGSEALLWWEKAGHLPPFLVTTGFPTDARPGALGQPNTLALSGAGNLDYRAFGGVRVFAGGWLDPHQVIGLDASGFVLDNRTRGLQFSSAAAGNPLLALRHLDPPSEVEDAFVITAPRVPGATVGPVAGSITILTHSQLWGADTNLLHALYWNNHFRLVGLAGFRYLDLKESVSLLTRRTAIDGAALSFLGAAIPGPALELTSDQFGARSQFFGGQVGLRGDYYFGHFFVVARGTLALGRTNEVANVLGLTTLQRAGAVQGLAGGLYALPSNSGHFVNQDFGVVPELQVTGGVLLTRWLRLTLGYNFLYWSRVMRAGNEIDLLVDPRQVPSDRSFQANTLSRFPRPVANPSPFWAQGLTLGLDFTF